MKIERIEKKNIFKSLKNFPVVAIVGARQVGKTTLAKEISNNIGKKCVYLDMENPIDYDILKEAYLFFKDNSDKLIIIDEIQLRSELFSVMRSFVDEKRRNGMFLILGSASPELLNKSSQSLAGRICYHELSPFSLLEVGEKKMNSLWIRGGFPDSFLAKNTERSFDWLASFVSTFLERDLNMMGFRLSPTQMRRVWTMTAHYHGSNVNYSSLAKSLEVSSHTIKYWLDVLTDTYMLRQLQPWSGNVAKRLVKSPKIYLRDSGVLHSLLRIESKEMLTSNPILGASWEGFVIEQIASVVPARSNLCYYRTSTGDEIDLIVDTPKNGKIAFEIKRSAVPALEKGFYNALDTVKPDTAYVVYSGDKQYRINEKVTALPLSMLNTIW